MDKWYQTIIPGFWQRAALLSCLLCVGCNPLISPDPVPSAYLREKQNQHRIQWPHDIPGRAANRMAIAERADLLALAGKYFGIYLFSIRTRNFIAQLDDPDDPELSKDYPGDRGIYALTFNPDESLLLSGDEAAQVKIWDVRARKLLHTLQTGAGRINSLSFSRDGQWLAVGGESGVVQIWNMQTYENVYSSSHPIENKDRIVEVSVDQLAFATGQQQLLIAAGAHMYTWEFKRDKQWQRLCKQPHYHAEYRRFTLSSSGRFLAAAKSMWDMQAGKLLTLNAGFDDRATQFDSMFFSHDEQVLYADASDGNLLAFDTASGRLLNAIRWQRFLRNVSGDDTHLLADGQTAIVFSPNIQYPESPVVFQDIHTGVERFPAQATTQHVPDRDKALSIDGFPELLSDDGKIRVAGNRLLKVGTFEVLKQFNMPGVDLRLRGIESVALSSNNLRYGVCALKRGEPKSFVSVWDVKSGAQLLELPAVNCTQVIFTPDARSILYVDRDLLLHKADIASGKTSLFIDRYKFITDTMEDETREVKIVPSNKQLVLAINTKFNQGYIAMHSWGSGERLNVFRHEQLHIIRTAKLSRDEQTAVLVNWVDSKLMVVDVPTRKLRWQIALPAHCCAGITITPDNNFIYGAEDNFLYRWESKSGKLLDNVRIGWLKPFSQYNQLEITPDANYLFVGSQVWDATTHRQILATKSRP